MIPQHDHFTEAPHPARRTRRASRRRDRAALSAHRSARGVPHARAGGTARLPRHRDRRGRLGAGAARQEPARLERPPLRRRGARRREAEPHPQRHRARPRAERDEDPRLVRRGGTLERSLRALRAERAHRLPGAAAQARRRSSPRPRSSAGSRRAPCGRRSRRRPSAWASTRRRERRRTSTASGRRATTCARRSRSCPASRARCSRSATGSASTTCHGPTRSRGCIRS